MISLTQVGIIVVGGVLAASAWTGAQSQIRSSAPGR